MNRAQKEAIQAQLKAEQKTLRELKQVYKKAREDCEKRIAQLNARKNFEPDNLQTIIYQERYQKALQKQIDAALKKLETKQYDTIADFIDDSYANGYTGVMYDLHKQGIPVTVPIDQEQVATAVQIDSKISKGLYTRLGEDVTRLKNSIRAEVSRGIANGSSWIDVAEKIAKGMNSPFDVAMNNSIRIARTEGHRVQQSAALDAQKAAKEAGAEIVKQWDAALDQRTRPAHAEADGQIREVDEPFDVGGEKLMKPGDGSAANAINCRCCILQRAKWALTEEELQTLKDRANYFGLDKTKDFEDFKNKYLQLPDDAGTVKLADTLQGIVDDLVNGKSSDRQALGERILKEYGVQGVPVNVKGMTDYGYCSIQVKGGKLVVTDYNLCAGDKRSIEYQIKTAFHEAYHASGNGYPTDVLTLNRTRWLDLEETFAESTAHYMAAQHGITGLTPSYADKLVKMLPRLKQLPEFKGCKTIADFGKVAQEARQKGGGSAWKDMSQRAMRKRFSWGSYTQKYFPKIRKDIPGYVDKILENMPDSKAYRKDMIDDLTKAMDNVDKIGTTLSDNQTLLLNHAVAVLMNTVGVL